MVWPPRKVDTISAHSGKDEGLCDVGRRGVSGCFKVEIWVGERRSCSRRPVV